MPDRSSGFLHPGERAYLIEKGFYPAPNYPKETESGGRRAKSRIQNEITPSVQQLILQFNYDLVAVHLLQRSDEEIWRKWETRILPAIKDDLESLRNDLDQMIDIAERDDFAIERNEIKGALAHLHDGEHHPSLKSPQELTREELEAKLETLKIREEGLGTLLQGEERSEILGYIYENEPCSLDGKRIGESGEYWTTVASRELRPTLVEKENVSNTKSIYRITEHGEAVLNCWQALTEISVLTMNGKSEVSKRQIIRDTLKLHELPLSVWQSWD